MFSGTIVLNLLFRNLIAQAFYMYLRDNPSSTIENMQILELVRERTANQYFDKAVERWNDKQRNYKSHRVKYIDRGMVSQDTSRFTKTNTVPKHFLSSRGKTQGQILKTYRV